MRTYYEVARRSLRRYMAYRAANYAGTITNIFWGFLYSYLTVALFESRSEVGGFDMTDALAYVWLSQALLMFSQAWGWWDIAESIRSGQVATDLTRPFDYYWYWLSHDVGRAVYYLLFRGVPVLVAGVALFGVRLTTDPLVWFAFLLSLVGAELVGFSFRFLVNLSTFWLLDHRGIGVVASIVTAFFSGAMVPNAFFPDWLRAVSDLLPFQSMVYLPNSLLLGKLTGAAVAGALLQQVGWFVALMLVGRALLAVATRRLVVQGG
jgi:ABC-2 type transport system permease protein